jgi:hypothetical protein
MPQQPRFPSRRTLARQPPPPGLYASTYDPELGAAICRRLAGGESLRAICRNDAAMPTEKTVWNWARAHEEFRLMKAHAMSTARARRLAARDEREFDKWVHFGGARGRTGRPSGYDPEVASAICTGLMMGRTLAQVCADPAAPCVGTVYNWLRKHPEFLEDYRRAKAMVEDVLVEESCEGLQRPGEERRVEPLLRRTVRAAEKRAARLSLKALAPPSGPAQLTVHMEDETGLRVIYEGKRPE